ncbi:MAG: phenylalanine--tRNA ligase subunit beta [Flammeovirgaceae bacterium]
MKLSLDWLREYIEINDSPEELAHILTMGGLEVEGISTYEKVPGGLKGLVVGEVLECGQHPNADKLRVTKVDIGDGEPKQIVCGAPNVAAGQKVVVATVGATLYPAGHDPFKIKKSKIRGEVSLGMICAEDEIGMGDDHDGIMVLDTELPNGTPAADYFNLQADHILEIGLTPNRADAASHFGAARDIKALYRKPIQFPDLSNFKVDNNDLPIEVVVENTEACPRYSGLTISGITVKESPDWLKQRLSSIGLTPINNVVDVTNYILHGLGQPLHAFDAAEVKGNKVIVKTLPAGSKFVTLDEVERSLSDQDLMICNEESGMCIAGVFGGIKSGVKDSTTAIFLESAYFNPAYIRKTSMTHGLKTDASFRYERGTDPNITITALKAAALLIQQVAGGSISSEVIDIYPAAISNFEVSVNYKNVDRLIGKVIPRDRIKEILTDLEMEVVNETEEGLTLSIPPYRVDVQREADVIEDILRIYGFNEIEVSENLDADFLANFPSLDKDNLRDDITATLAANGAFEIFTNSLTKPEYASWEEGIDPEASIEMLNKLSVDLGVLRQSMVFSGLEVVAHNVNRRQKDVKVFDYGKTYKKAGEGFEEHEKLCIYVSGNQQAESWIAESSKANFHTIASLVQLVMEKIGVEGYETNDADHGALQYGIQYVKNNTAIAQFGLVKPSLCKKVGLKQEVFYAELDWEYLIKKGKKKVVFQEIPKFPEVRRDLSLVLNKAVTFDEVRKLAKQSERKLLQAMNVFSVYEGESIGAGKKSYAISFILQDKDKTLTDKVIDKSMNRLIQAFEQQLGAIIRK